MMRRPLPGRCRIAVRSARGSRLKTADIVVVKSNPKRYCKALFLLWITATYKKRLMQETYGGAGYILLPFLIGQLVC